MASVNETLTEINKVLKQNTTDRYSKYSCKTVSWDDVQRGTVGGGLSCWGSNITDTRLYAKDGRRLFTVRGDNWNERLGVVGSDELALIASNVNGGGTCSEILRPITLKTLLSNLYEYGSYAGLPPANDDDNKTLDFYKEELDDKVSVRFQTTFLPVDEEEEGGEQQQRKTLEFAPEAYNYNTTRDDDPRNLVLLCTTQGLALQQDGKGAKKLFHHVKDDESGDIHRYWFEAETSSHKVGGSQKETQNERDDALKRGKATSAVIGTRAIGTRFNVLMTIQIPLKQQQRPLHKTQSAAAAESYVECEEEEGGEEFMGGGCLFGDDDDSSYSDNSEGNGMPAYMLKSSFKKKITCKSRPPKKEPKKGTSSAARVSRGSLYDTTWEGLSVKKLERHPSEHVTATIVMYYTCSGGVPTAEDVKKAVDDLEELYQAVETNGNLADDDFNFMKSELTVIDVADIGEKLKTQPPPPIPSHVTNGDIFPTT